MFRRSEPVTVPPGNLDLTQPHDACLKCGRPTPLGVSLCDNDNPANIKSPSTTQVHATILVGVIVGIGLLLLLFRFGSAGIGPFPSSLSATSTRADGGIDVAVTVTNKGAQDFRDYVFFTQPIQPGETKTFTQTMPPPLPDSGTTLTAVNLVVKCS
jgi:hypothetical protein